MPVINWYWTLTSSPKKIKELNKLSSWINLFLKRINSPLILKDFTDKFHMCFKKGENFLGK